MSAPLQVAAVSGEARGIMSTEFIRNNSLGSASIVQNSARRLLELNIITRIGDVYTVNDPMLGIWLRAEYGPAPFRLLEEPEN